VLISDDATVPTIDEALAVLRTRRLNTALPIIRAWITEDIDELLEMRTERTYQDATVALLQT
jgi:hypothetical protein